MVFPVANLIPSTLSDFSLYNEDAIIDPDDMSEFGQDLLEILTQMLIPRSVINAVARVNFSTAKVCKCIKCCWRLLPNRNKVRLVASTPGTHLAAGMKKWGHLRLAEIVRGMGMEESTEQAVTYEVTKAPFCNIRQLVNLAF